MRYIDKRVVTNANMKKTIFIALITLFCEMTIAQNEKNIFKFNDLGFLNKDNTFGNFDGGMNAFKVVINDYSYQRQENEISLFGIVVDKSTNEPFCDIQLLLGKKNVVEKKLQIEKKVKIDCTGKFEIKFKLEKDIKIYFWIIGYSLLECEIDMTKI